MATKHDYWEGDASTDHAYSMDSANDYNAQTFTASASYYATVAKLWLAKGNGANIGTVTVGLRHTDGASKPTGGDLAYATLDSDDINTVAEGYAWHTFTFTTGVNLVSGTKYAVVIRASAADGTNQLHWVTEDDNPYANGGTTYSTNAGTSWSAESATDDALFSIWGDPPAINDKTYSNSLIAIGNNEVWYESTAGTMAEFTDANGGVNVGDPLNAVVAYQKLFIANKSLKKVADFINTKISTADAGANPCTHGMTLTGATSTAAMIVDYADAVTDDAAANVYGYRTTIATFASGETVSGTNGDGDAVSFVLNAAEDAPPHWYNWTVFGNDTTNYGTMLTKPTLICLYRGRLVISGDNLKPQAWQMTKVGDPWKVKYDYDNDGELSAVAYSNNLVGEIGDIVTALISYKDDLLIFGCANSIWILVGDPMASGQLAEITNATGIWGARAWCFDENKNLYFLGSDGIYKMAVGETYSTPTNISKAKLPNLMSDLALNKNSHRVILSYDPDEYGIIISKTAFSDGTNTNYFFSLLTNGYFPETYPSSCGVFSSHFYNATNNTYKKFLVGGTDGYIREFDPSTKNDATTSSTSAISSYCSIIKQMGDNELNTAQLMEFSGILSGGAADGDFTDADTVTWALYKGDNAETVLEDIKDGATAFTSGTWSSVGKQNRKRPRMRGCWMGVKLYDSTASKTWSVEKIYGDVIPRSRI